MKRIIIAHSSGKKVGIPVADMPEEEITRLAQKYAQTIAKDWGNDITVNVVTIASDTSEEEVSFTVNFEGGA